MIRFSWFWLVITLIGAALYITDIKNTYFSKWMIITGLVMLTISYYFEVYLKTREKK